MHRQTGILAASTAILLALASVAHAAGTSAGVSIDNAIDIEFDVGSKTFSSSDLSGSSVIVDRAVAFTHELETSPATVTASPGESDVMLVYRIVNTGNHPTNFDFDVTYVPGGQTLGLVYDGSDSGTEGTYTVFKTSDLEGGSPALYDPAGISGASVIAPDADYYLIVLVQMPSDVANGASDSFDVSVRPTSDGGTALLTEVTGLGLDAQDTVFADAGADGVESVDTGAVSLAAPALSATKTMIVVSENLDGSFDCLNDAAVTAEAALPGACVEYEITITNAESAGAAATDVEFYDELPTETQLVGVSENDGFDYVNTDSLSVGGGVSTLAIGSSASVKIRAEVR